MDIKRCEDFDLAESDNIFVRKYSDYIWEFLYEKTILDDRKDISKKEWKQNEYKTLTEANFELNNARGLMLSNISPQDVPYAYFLTLTKRQMTLTEANNNWNELTLLLKKKMKAFRAVVVFEKCKNGFFHLHAIIWDPAHRYYFKYMLYNMVFSNWSGNTKILHINDFEDLISKAFYITKKNKNGFNFIKHDEKLFATYGKLKECSPIKKADINSLDLKNSKEFISYSFEIRKKDFNKKITTKYFINERIN